MTITLTPEQERVIRAQIASGRFRSVEEALDHFLGSHQQQNSGTAEPESKVRARAAADRIRKLRKAITLDRPKGMSLREYTHIGDKY